MRRRLSYVPGALLVGAIAVFSLVRGNIVGAVVYGAMALWVAWLTVRPEPEPDRTVRPLRTVVLGAAGASLVALWLVTAAVTETDRKAAGLAVVAAVLAVPFAAFTWWLVYMGWKKGYRWSTSATQAELADLADRERNKPPD